MHTWLYRANAIFFHTLTVLAVLTAMNVATNMVYTDPSEVSVELSEIWRLRKIESLRCDSATLSFNLNANFTQLFEHWNTKQVFVYVVAEYETEWNPVNQIVIWDKIVEHGDDHHIVLNDQPMKYPYLVDQGFGFRGNTIRLSVGYDIMPIAGILSRKHAGTTEFTFPDEYGEY